MFLDLLLDTLIAFRELGRKITYLHQKRLNSPKNSAENPTFRQSPFSVLCHNICCLIQSMYELGLKPKFYAQVA
jgi:hypothetical protein